MFASGRFFCMAKKVLLPVFADGTGAALSRRPVRMTPKMAECPRRERPRLSARRRALASAGRWSASGRNSEVSLLCARDVVVLLPAPPSSLSSPPCAGHWPLPPCGPHASAAVCGRCITACIRRTLPASRRERERRFRATCSPGCSARNRRSGLGRSKRFRRVRALNGSERVSGMLAGGLSLRAQRVVSPVLAASARPPLRKIMSSPCGREYSGKGLF